MNIESHVKDAQLKSFFEEKFQNTTEQLKSQFEEFKRDLAQRMTMLKTTVVYVELSNFKLSSVLT